MNYRHLTPSMSLLLIFESAARHQSFVRAAEELSLSQSAVSRQMRQLETHLDIALFERVGRSVRLTEQGEQYAVAIHEALDKIRGATLQVMSKTPRAETLSLAILPTFASKWVLPNLHTFYGLYPSATIHIQSRIGKIDFNFEDIDAAIIVSRIKPSEPELISYLIANEYLVAVASPKYVESSKIKQKKDIEIKLLAPEYAAGHLLLSVSSHPAAWSEWFSHYGLDHRQICLGPNFEVTAHLIQAVSAGIGLGIVPEQFVRDELEQGSLVAVGEPILSPRSYYLIYPKRMASNQTLQQFLEWVLTNDFS